MNMLRHFEKMLRIFPFSPKNPANSALSIYGVAYSEPTLLEQDFAGRVLPVDLEAAVIYAELAAGGEAKKRPVEMADAQIAAICLARGAKLATRNLKHFEGLGLVLVNPWGVADGR